MRLHHFFIGEKIGERPEFPVTKTELLHQWRNVFRFKAGDAVVLFDNSGFEFPAEFVSLGPKGALLRIAGKRRNLFSPKRELALCFSIIKKDRMEWILEKGTELGVSRFQPIEAERGIPGRGFPRARAEKILAEAAEQSGRGVLPALAAPVSLAAALAALASPALAFDRSGLSFSREIDPAGAMACFIGPEGGWSGDELSRFAEKNVSLASLGRQTLRAETAAVAAAALLLL